MGMVLGLAATDDETIEKLFADPPLIWKFLAPDDPEIYDGARKEQTGGGLFARMFGRKPIAPPVEVAEMPRPVEEIDLDKSWHGIHYLLTKTGWEGEPPLNFLILGGEEVGSIDVGYGTARAFRSDEVSRIHEALQHIDGETLRSRFDPADMMGLEIYPEIWDRDPADDDTFGYCAEYFDDLKNFLARTTEAKLGLVISLS
jgi:hypothetical protein